MFYHFKIWSLLGQIISQSLNNLTQHRRWHFKKERFYFLFTNIQPINFLKLQIYELSKKINFLFYKCKCLLACMYVHCVCVQCPQRPEEDIWAVVSFHVGARNWTWILSNTPNLWTIFPGSVFFVCLFCCFLAMLRIEPMAYVYQTSNLPQNFIPSPFYYNYF